ncbi:TonB-dependent siderophore receptor [Novosphingobium sp. 2580]|uniref:TonB-dependent siderophore receptor n=2 Tax=Novosphingobium album (ex Hu et al. 2023) TaxID=2930093 RepID=A0ABT0B762_9SPHN|nr:TonB-dependent siderophore receptor [Novosphingobium album (ex Hu et al. 2023)]
MLALPAVAHAEDAASETVETSGDITVVGKREAYRGDVPLQEIPQSVQVIDGKVLKELNITTLDAALELSSSVARQNSFGGLWDSYAIRGFAGDENYPSGYLVNGFNGGRGYGGPRDASNIERIEILKGPNGAVFGRGEPGGTVSIITKKAKVGETFGSFGVSGGSYNTYRVEGDYNLSITDTLAVRVNGAFQEADSFRDTVNTSKKVATPSVLFQPDNKTSLSYELEYVDQKIPFDRGIAVLDGDFDTMDKSTFLGNPLDGPIHVKVLGHQFEAKREIFSNWVLLAGFGYRETSFEGYSSEPELAASRQILDETGNYVSRQRRYRDNSIDSMVFRSEISGSFYTGPFEHHVLIGADRDILKIRLHQYRYRPPSGYTAGSAITSDLYAINIDDPVYVTPPATTSLVTDTYEKQKAWGIYFQDQIDITSKLKVRAGGRYDDFRQSIYNYATAAYLEPNHYTKFSPTFGGLYEITDTLSAFVGYGRGFRPNGGTNAELEPFKPELSKSIEAGLRFELAEPQISATLAAFRMSKDNILTADLANPNFSVAAGSARSKGIEFDATATLPADINLIVSYSYTDAYWTTDAVDPSFGLNISAGDPLINIPKHQASAYASKTFDLGSAGKFSFGAGVNYSSKRLGETGVDFYLPGYTLVRAVASYSPTESTRISLDARNLFNETWYASSYHHYWVMPGTPRTVTLKGEFFF